MRRRSAPRWPSPLPRCAGGNQTPRTGRGAGPTGEARGDSSPQTPYEAFMVDELGWFAMLQKKDYVGAEKTFPRRCLGIRAGSGPAAALQGTHAAQLPAQDLSEGGRVRQQGADPQPGQCGYRHDRGPQPLHAGRLRRRARHGEQGRRGFRDARRAVAADRAAQQLRTQGSRPARCVRSSC